MTDYTQSFLSTWGLYPKRNGQKRGKHEAFVEWQKLDLEEQRKAYSDIKARNMAGGWEFIRDMVRYLKHRSWEDEWRGQKVTSDPDLISSIQAVSAEDLVEYAMRHRNLCEHQVRANWNYYGPEVGIFRGVVIPDCKPCGRPMSRVESSEVPV